MAYRYIKNIWANLRQLANAGVWTVADSGIPTATTGVGMLGPGSVYIDTATGIAYSNAGTILVPSWVGTGVVSNGIAGGAAGGGLGAVGNAKMTYSFAVDGGAIATITPTNSPTLPAGAIILGGVIDITTALTSGASATIALGFGSGAQVAALKAATAVASFGAGTTLVLIPLFTSATYYKLTAAARMTLTVAVATLTAGVMDINVAYVQGNV